MAFQSILPVASRNGASGSGQATMPAGKRTWTLRCDLGTPNTFTDSVTQSLTVTIDASFDGGTTWQTVDGCVWNGSSTGTWGKNGSLTNPSMGPSAVPQGAPIDDFPGYPMDVRGSYVQVGHFSFGLSLELL